MNNEFPEPDQKIDIEGSSIDGQVGQAGRDLRQFQFIFRGRKSKPLDSRDRQALLDKVKNFWIKGALEELSRNQPWVDPDIEERLDLLAQAWGMVYETPDQLRQTFPKGTKVIDRFDQMGEGGTLLILGELKSGKTRTLLELARELINRAELNAENPLPTIFSLSLWRGYNQSIADWLSQELQQRYRVSKTFSKILIKDEHLILLLDGLNEVRSDRQESCIQALNKFIQQYGKTEVIVCSCIEKYKTLSNCLKFQSAIHIKPSVGLN